MGTRIITNRKTKTIATVLATAAAFAALGVGAVSGQGKPDKYTLKVPGGLAFAEFRGYENWPAVTVHHTADLTKVIVANQVAMDAFRAGIPRNGKPFPDGAKLAKVEWKSRKSSDSPYDVSIAGTIYDVDFMVKDSKRFPDGNGWGYAVFKFDPATKAYAPATDTHRPPQNNDAKCGVACHTIVKGKDFVFSEYSER